MIGVLLVFIGISCIGFAAISPGIDEFSPKNENKGRELVGILMIIVSLVL